MPTRKVGLTLMTMSLWTLIQKYIDDTGATEAAVMRKANLNKGAFTAWRARGVPSLPSRAVMLDLADALKVDYETVLTAVLHDTAYLPEQRARDEQRRLDDLQAERDRTRAGQLRKHVNSLLAEREGDVDEAVALNDELRLDGSIDPALAQEADDFLRQMLAEGSARAASVFILTGDEELPDAAHDEQHSIEDEQGHDETA